MAVSIALSPNLLWAETSVFFESDPLEEQINSVRETMDSMPLSATHPAPWTFGYASSWDDEPEKPLIIEIKFMKAEVVDLVVMLPATLTDFANVKQSLGFPVRFSLERLLTDGSVEMIANHLNADYEEPGMGPQLFTCPKPVLTTGLRITVTQRAKNASWWRTSHVVALSELFAFAGDRNVALHGRVMASSSFNVEDAWAPEYLTDGFLLYSQTNHKLSDPTHVFRSFEDEVQLEIDLGQQRVVDEFRFWPMVQSPSFNFPLSLGVGFPRSFRVEVAGNHDFSDTKLFYEKKDLAQQPGGGPYMRQAEGVSGRYVRITLRDGIRDFRREDPGEISLGEIELLEHGKVVSGGLPFRSRDAETVGIELLTDGFVSDGEILSLRQWLTQFQQRVASLQQLRVLWPAATEARIRDGKRTTAFLLLAIGLIVALAQLVWVVRVVAHRRWARMRERIACDLHDEIGANVSSIAHTAELLKETMHAPSETQSRLLGNLIESAHLTTRETKHFVSFIENEEQDRDLTEQFAQVANRILGTIPAKFSLENTRSFNALDPTTKWNLLLFFKEALNNIIKHAKASAVEIHTRRTGSVLLLEISDNGCGMPEGSPSCRHLESRAKVLGGQLGVHSRLSEGTRVTLNFSRTSQS
ncbi:MAG: sensor histidine kinase [Luteolibacter sp.]